MIELGSGTFDFWLGTWDCGFDGGHAVNTVTRELGDRVIREHFVVDRPRSWTGTSVSVHSNQAGWRQTWVDESGNYWAFVGGLVDGCPSFATPVPVDGDDENPPLYKRMVFTDITDDGFNWRWESSPDGDRWTIDWRIRYSRRP
ncbi:MAG: hypothetical protein OER95_14265 [Acidimicrobiia bacterium]|nr:hypothetical protein [Acidimicrobiia bacterium]